MKRDFEKKENFFISSAAHDRIVAALKLSALNKKLLGNKYLPVKSMWEKWAALNAMKNYSRRIVSPSYEDLQGSREQR